jgi:hypothetical protein
VSVTLLLLLLLIQGPEGAGMRMQSVANASLSNTTFYANTASRAGGGLAVLRSNLGIISSSISHNTAQLGGGIAADSSQVTLQDVVLDANAAALLPNTRKQRQQQQQQQPAVDEAGSATSVLQFASMMYAEGSAGGLLLQRSTLTVANTQLTGNSADWEAGALLLQQPGQFTIRSSRFDSNTARDGSGGGLVARGGGPSLATGVISNCSFDRNTAAGSGGSVVLDSGIGLLEVQYEQCTFSGSAAGLDGGGIAAAGPTVLQCRECEATGHTAARIGGWLSCLGCRSLILQDSSSSGNQAAAAGGSVSCNGCGVFESQGSSYSDNVASDGGALAVQATADVGIDSCQFDSNEATAQQASAAAEEDPRQQLLHQLPPAWQALYAGADAEAAITGSSSSSQGGAGGGMLVAGVGSAVLVSNTLRNNSGSTGGAIYASVASSCATTGQAFLTSKARSSSSSSSSSSSGGGGRSSGSSSSNSSCQIQLANLTANDNTASLAGGVLYTSTPKALQLETEVTSSSGSSTSVQPATGEQQQQLLQQLAADNSAGAGSSQDVDSCRSGAASAPVRLSLLRDADLRSIVPLPNTGRSLLQQQQQQQVEVKAPVAGMVRDSSSAGSTGRRLQQFGGRGFIGNLGIASENTIRSASDAVDATSAGKNVKPCMVVQLCDICTCLNVVQQQSVIVTFST